MLACFSDIARAISQTRSFIGNDQSPRYQLGIWSMIVSHLLEVVIILTLRLLSRENERRDRMQRESEGEEAKVDRERERDRNCV
jgi:hypothetical protein